MYKRTKVINFLGGPSSGKSTAAAEKFVELKKKGYSVYLVQEVATDAILDGDLGMLKNQRTLFAHQAKRMLRAMNKVDYIICECPILLNIAYARYNGNTTPEFEKEVIKFHKSFDNVTIYLPIREDYKQVNRVHNLEQAKEIDKIIKDVIKDAGEVYCQECHKVTPKIVKYGTLTMDYCQECRDKRFEHQRD